MTARRRALGSPSRAASREQVIPPIHDNTPAQYGIGHNGGPTLPPLKPIIIPKKFEALLQPKRYKIFYGGRGGAKSWNFARVLIALAYSSRKRILCARELQTSIKDSVHRLLTDQIEVMGLSAFFDITRDAIRCPVMGSEFLFKGLRHNSAEIKSTEGIDIVWVEEAQLVSEDSWELLGPTIRKSGSEIWVSYNPDDPEGETHKRFATKNPPRPDALVVKVNWSDNPFFPPELEAERLYMLSDDPEAYEHVWEGNPKVMTDAVIFRRRYVVEPFETPEGVRFFHGVDWGFANDPCAVIRSFIEDNTLYIDQEQFGHGVEFEELPALFDGIPDIRSWPLKADGSRPETISYMRRQGYNITDAKKWPGSVEDGIAHLKGFKRIVIHPRCVHMAQEARLYSFKVDKITNDILPIIVDKHNHGWDAVRYSLDGYIQARGTDAIWSRLGED